MTQDELKLVLEALKWCHGGEPCGTAEAIAVIEKALAQPEQERPVDCERCNRLEEQAYDLVGKLRVANIKLSMPPQRTWVGLTAGEILDALISVDEKTVRLPSMLGQFACAIEAKLKERNT